ncbi:MAG: hypothetical protein NUV56_02010 [Candidatus Uhrbacteria bacterium]|nr:hypothetical protein [Candidatus Uhrbacteria bacterium]
MLGITLNLPPAIEHYFAVTPLPVMMSHALLAVGWFPIFAVIIWGLTHVWVDMKEGKFQKALKWVMLEVSVPQDAINTPKGMENFFINLAGVKSGIVWREKYLVGKVQAKFSLEIVSNGGRIQFIVRAIDKYRDLVEAAIYAQYPEAQIIEVDDYSHEIPYEYPNDEYDVFGTEMVLANPSYLPLRTYEEFEHQGEKDFRFKDPLLPILELMGKMQPGEHFWIQILIKPPADQDWVKEGAKYLNAMMGKEEKHKPSSFEQLSGAAMWLPKGVLSQLTGFGAGDAHAEAKKDEFRMFRLTPQERLQLEAVAEKISKVGWYTKIRWVYAAKKTNFRKGLLASGAKGIFGTFTHQYLNGLSIHGPATPKDDYFWQAWSMPKKQKLLVKRYQGRKFDGAPPYILNVTELATIFHFPAADARTPMLTQLGARRSEAPSALTFAADGVDSLPNWKEAQGEEQGTEMPGTLAEPPQFAVPTPTAPSMPQAPAGPDGEDFDDASGAPPNLPV